MRGLDGLNEPHLILGKIHAQAYDMSAFKCAADAVLVAEGVELLFHALAAGVGRPGGDRASCSRRSRAGVAVRGRTFVDCSGDGDLAHWAGVPRKRATTHGHLLYPTLMFRVGNVDAVRAGEAWRSIPELMDAAEPQEFASRAAVPSCARRSTPPSGA